MEFFIGVFLPIILFVVVLVCLIITLAKTIIKWLKKKGLIGAVVSSVPIKEYEPSEDEEED